MKHFDLLSKIKGIFESGGNIIEYLNSIKEVKLNSIEDIMISYDFQAGSYIKNYYENQEYSQLNTSHIAKVLNDLAQASEINSLLEVGIGEATTLFGVVSKLNKVPNKILGFDISWSRLNYAKQFLEKKNLKDVNLFVADLFNIPLSDNSVEFVYTSHSIEPNGGYEKEALEELYRITSKYLVLIEPGYEFASNEGKERMKKNGYVTHLYETAIDLNYKVIEYRRFETTINPLNPSCLIVIEKNTKSSNHLDLLCPISKKRLKITPENFLYSSDGHLAYPMLCEIPCLLKDNAILAIHYGKKIGEEM